MSTMHVVYATGAVVMFAWLCVRTALDKAAMRALFEKYDFPATRSVGLALFAIAGLLWPVWAVLCAVVRKEDES